MPLYAGWIAIGGLAVLDLIWLVVGGYSVANGNYRLLRVLALLVIALLLQWRWPKMAARTQALAQNLCIIPALLILVYLCAAGNFPLRDDWLVAADHVFGFYWPSVYRTVASSRGAMDVLGIFYFFAFDVQAIGFLLVLPFIDPQRNTEFVVLAAITLTIIAVLSMVIPAEGPLFYLHQPTDELHYGLVLTVETLRQLRSGAMTVIDFVGINGGMIVFPSAHAASVVFYSYILRGTGMLFNIALVVNALMLVSIPIIGGHYLSDVLAGLLVAAAAIAVVRLRQEGRLRDWGEPSLHQ